MKILVINNNTKHMSSLVSSIEDHDIEVRKYHPGLDFSCSDKDLIILSGGGGEGVEIYDEHKPGELWYDDEMEFILANDKPMIGICMGFEVIASAFGAPITQVGSLVQGTTSIQTTASGKKLFNKNFLSQFESHRWHVEDLPKEFTSLAKSKTGYEAFEYKTEKYNILATQFHPEKGGSLELSRLVEQLALA